MAELTYEQALSKLERIVDELENGSASLEDSIKLFEEGTKLADFCNTKLNTAEQRFTQLLNKSRGE